MSDSRGGANRARKQLEDAARRQQRLDEAAAKLLKQLSQRLQSWAGAEARSAWSPSNVPEAARHAPHAAPPAPTSCPVLQAARLMAARPLPQRSRTRIWRPSRCCCWRRCAGARWPRCCACCCRTTRSWMSAGGGSCTQKCLGWWLRWQVRHGSLLRCPGMGLWHASAGMTSNCTVPNDDARASSFPQHRRSVPPLFFTNPAGCMRCAPLPAGSPDLLPLLLQPADSDLLKCCVPQQVQQAQQAQQAPRCPGDAAAAAAGKKGRQPSRGKGSASPAPAAKAAEAGDGEDEATADAPPAANTSCWDALQARTFQPCLAG